MYQRLIIERLDMGWLITHEHEDSWKARYGFNDDDLQKVIEDIGHFLGVTLQIDKESKDGI